MYPPPSHQFTKVQLALLVLLFSGLTHAQNYAILSQSLPTLTNVAQYTSYINGQFSAFTYCSNLLATCPPSRTSCATSYCSGCQTLAGQATLNSCCSSGASGMVDCFRHLIDSYHSHPPTTTGPAPTKPGGVSTAGGGYQACVNSSQYNTICESLTPGFATLTAFALKAPCLCYDPEHKWAPQVYDSWVSSCNSWLGFLPPTATATETVNTDPCKQVGDVVSQYARTQISSSMATQTGDSEDGSDSSAPSTTNRLGLGGVSIMACVLLALVAM